jgi:hypothetical protein
VAELQQQIFTKLSQLSVIPTHTPTHTYVFKVTGLKEYLVHAHTPLYVFECVCRAASAKETLNLTLKRVCACVGAEDVCAHTLLVQKTQTHIQTHTQADTNTQDSELLLRRDLNE